MAHAASSSGALSPTSLKLASEVVNVDLVDLEVMAFTDAINDDRIDSLVWDYLNQQIAICIMAQEKTGNDDDKDEKWSKAFVDAYLCGGNNIESQRKAIRSILWTYFTKMLDLPGFETWEALKADWEKSILHFRNLGHDV
jgi:hypothetical protein